MSKDMTKSHTATDQLGRFKEFNPYKLKEASISKISASKT